MRKLTLRMFVVLLIISVSLTLLPISASAANITTMDLGYSPHFPGDISIQGRTITVSDIPATASYRFLWIRVYCTISGAEAFQQISERDGGGNAEFRISLTNGRYYMELFHSGIKYSPYRSVFHGKAVELDWRGGSGSIIQPQMYTHNSAVSGGKREDIAALAYYLTPSTRIQSDNPEIVRFASQITAGLAGSYSKAMAIHDWVCDNIYYNYDEYYMRTPYGDFSALGVLKSRTGVCEGYANITAALMRAAGIPAKLIGGYALGLSTNEIWPADIRSNMAINHVWNEVYVDGRWIILDTTWDSGNRFEYGRFIDSSGLQSHRYFDVSPMLFATTHAIKNYSESDIDVFVRNSTRTATPSAGRVRINNAIDLQMGLYNIGGNNYIRLRDAAAMLNRFDYGVAIGWSGSERSITIDTGAQYSGAGSAISSSSSSRPVQAVFPAVHVYLNGEKVFMPAYSINGSTYFRLRDIARLLNFGVGYDSGTQTVLILL